MTTVAASGAYASRIALIGNPNCGKTALFNRLTGSRQKVANYAGVTVERKEGELLLPSKRSLKVLDLPGTYSLHPLSPDEMVAVDICRGRHPSEAAPDLLVCVVDATNLRLHLRFALELRQLGRPMVIALNMMDEAQRRGIKIDTQVLQTELGVPVIETIAVSTKGIQALVQAIEHPLPKPPAGLPNQDLHQETRRLLNVAVQMPQRMFALENRIDRVVLHPVFGLLLLSAIMFLVFQAVFAWAAPLQDLFASGIGWLGEKIATGLPEGILRSLLLEGIVAGVGTVIEFLPQILLLFAFILWLEESGYLPRAAFLLDRLMLASGLSGRSFIPLLSSFACAIPGIMATRSIQDPRDRLVTIMVAPLMTCSARLPVYTLLISAFIPRQKIAHIIQLQGLVLFALYAAGIASALLVSWIMRRSQKNKTESPLLMELPNYRLPRLRDLLIGLWERARIFLRRVTSIILALTVLLWVLTTFPGAPENAALPAIDYSFAGQLGHWMEPFFAPLGFNWQICIALIPGLAAREVAVSSLATVYALSAASEDMALTQLSAIVSHSWSLATALSLLVWYIYAPMCLSTLAVIRRETNSWRQVFVASFYLFAMAYIASLITYQLTRWLS